MLPRRRNKSDATTAMIMTTNTITRSDFSIFPTTLPTVVFAVETAASEVALADAAGAIVGSGAVS